MSLLLARLTAATPTGNTCVAVAGAPTAGGVSILTLASTTSATAAGRVAGAVSTPSATSAASAMAATRTASAAAMHSATGTNAAVAAGRIAGSSAQLSASCTHAGSWTGAVVQAYSLGTTTCAALAAPPTVDTASFVGTNATGGGSFATILCALTSAPVSANATTTTVATQGIVSGAGTGSGSVAGSGTWSSTASAGGVTGLVSSGCVGHYAAPTLQGMGSWLLYEPFDLDYRALVDELRYVPVDQGVAYTVPRDGVAIVVGTAHNVWTERL